MWKFGLPINQRPTPGNMNASNQTLSNISSYNIKTALKEIDEELYVETIEKIAASKNNTIKESNLFKKKKKIYDSLYRKGYESSLIQETIQKLFK